MTDMEVTPPRVLWARLRFSIIGPLLASPPGPGEVATRVAELAAICYRNPHTQAELRLSAKAIERWYYMARKAADPIDILARKVPKHAGKHVRISELLAAAIVKQHTEHMRWSYQLHHDNLVIVCRENTTVGPMVSYTTLRRFMRKKGLIRVRRRARKNDESFVPREVRSYEVEHVHALWHLDFHEGSRSVLTSGGEWKKPQLLGILDDRSRICCHLQWYFEETADALIHGLSQAFHKRGLPRALLTDNGSAMIAAETVQGLERLSIVAKTTLPATPEQNGKQECFWGQIEGRLLPMLEGEPNLTLELLNRATQAWVEHEYHHKVHSEISETPMERMLRGPSVGRESPTSETLRRAFRKEITRTQRRSDGTTTVEGVRFEVPAVYRTLIHLRLRVARWDLSSVDLVDPRTGTWLATLRPLDKAQNARGARRELPDPSAHEARAPVAPPGIAPLLRSLMAEYSATGLPPGYLPRGVQQ